MAAIMSEEKYCLAADAVVLKNSCVLCHGRLKTRISHPHGLSNSPRVWMDAYGITAGSVTIQWLMSH